MFVVSHAEIFLTAFLKDVSELLVSKFNPLWPHLAVQAVTVIICWSRCCHTNTMLRGTLGLGPKSPPGMDPVPLPDLPPLTETWCEHGTMPLFSPVAAPSLCSVWLGGP